ncbi:MAG: universal stress protein [Longimicrobiales bacterium]|nr:universal stress protein [Longimicrobiales bacterium]
MLRSLLVPLDGTRFSELALPLAEGIAQATGASLHLAHVHVPHPPEALLANTQFVYEGVNMEEYEHQDRTWEQTYLAALAERVARESAAQVDTALLEGEISTTLETYARQVGADAVVISTHSRTGVRRVWMGSVAEALIRAGDVPVLAVHAEEGDPVGPPLTLHNILVPLDGSELSESILPPAIELGIAFGARVTLLQVVSSRFPSSNGLVPALPQHWTEALQAGEDYLERVARRIRVRGLRVEPIVMAHSSPSTAIRDVAEEVRADLVAMATHGYTGMKRALFGSVAEDVLRHTRVPLLVRRPV